MTSPNKSAGSVLNSEHGIDEDVLDGVVGGTAPRPPGSSQQGGQQGAASSTNTPTTGQSAPSAGPVSSNPTNPGA